MVHSRYIKRCIVIYSAAIQRILANFSSEFDVYDFFDWTKECNEFWLRIAAVKLDKKRWPNNTGMTDQSEGADIEFANFHRSQNIHGILLNMPILAQLTPHT